MDNIDSNSKYSGLRTLAGIFAFIAVPVGLAQLYPTEAHEAYVRAGQILRGELGPKDLIPKDGQVVQVQSDVTAVTDIPLQSAQAAYDETQARRKRMLDEAVAAEAEQIAAAKAAAGTPANAPAIASSPIVSGSAQGTMEGKAQVVSPAVPALPATPAAQSAPVRNRDDRAATIGALPQATVTATPKTQGAPVAPAGGAALPGSPLEAGARPEGAGTSGVPGVDAQTLKSLPKVQVISAPQGEGIPGFVGVLTGEVDGTQAGQLVLTVASSGQVKGRFTNQVTQRMVQLGGEVDLRTGQVQLIQIPTTAPVDMRFTGTLSANGGSGQWAAAGQASGSWRVSRLSAQMKSVLDEAAARAGVAAKPANR